jgi:hypothetical protein
MDTQVTYKEELFNALFHSKGFGIAVSDLKGNCMDCNEKALVYLAMGEKTLLN